MKRKGVSKMFEMEAEESEDEWHGVGGADGELSDEYDSELEKMVDDYTKTTFDPAEIRQMLAAEDKEYDEKIVNKILHDIKNGGFRRRGKGALDIELSDDEDDELQRYHAKRRELLRQKVLENGEASKLVSNPKSHAFFESMVEDLVESKNPFSIGETADPDSGAISENDKVDNASEHGTQPDAGGQPVRTERKRIKISQEFVQRSLSFLNSKDELDNEFELDRRLAKHQHSTLGDDNDDLEDLFTLKQNSCIKTLHTPARTSSRTVDLEVDGNSPANGFKLPSVISSFSSRIDINEKFKEGTKTVKVSKSYKTIGGSRASITYLGKVRKLNAPKRKESGRKPVFGHRHPEAAPKRAGLFADNDDSFEA